MTQKMAAVLETLSEKVHVIHSGTCKATKTHLWGVSPDRDILMQLLSSCLPLVEAATATIALLDCYNSYADVVAAPYTDLKDVACVGENGAHLLKCVHTAAIHLSAAPLQWATGVSDWAGLSAYLNTSMARERSEIVRVLFLNPRNHVISDQILARGTASFVNVSVRDIIQKSLQLGATAILLLHNHPSGDPMPSPEDLDMTKTIENTLTPLGIRLHDHIIVGKGRSFSLKGMKFIFRDSEHLN